MHFTDAADGEMASPNRVYVFPPGMEMTVADDVFSLRPRSKRLRLRIRRTCRCPGLIQGLSTTYSNQTPSRRVSNRLHELTSLDRFGYAVNALARLFHISPRRSWELLLVEPSLPAWSLNYWRNSIGFGLLRSMRGPGCEAQTNLWSCTFALRLP